MTNFTPNKVLLYSQGTFKPAEARVPDELEITLTVNGEIWLSFMCSPFQIEQLAVGFLFNEGIIRKSEEIAQVWLCANKTNIDIWLNHPAQKPKTWKRTSGCTGGFTATSQHNWAPSQYQEIVCPETILNSFARLLEKQNHYRLTRGIHCAMLTDGADLYYIAEDIGRHNCIDKLAGFSLTGQKYFDRKIILTTGRISSEMLQKSARIGAEIVVSRTSPTSNSIETAENLKITLIGYARRNQFTIYSHPGRIAMPATSKKNYSVFCN